VYDPLNGAAIKARQRPLTRKRLNHSYGGSIPLTRAMSENAAGVADERSTAPTDPWWPGAGHHGSGYIGARSVKWLTAITVQPFPSENYFSGLKPRFTDRLPVRGRFLL
jgi:hypothetical protein